MLAVIDCQGTLIGPAQAVSLFENCFENRREVTRRGIDDLQDFLGCFFPGECFSELTPQFGVVAFEIAGILSVCHLSSPVYGAEPSEVYSFAAGSTKSRASPSSPAIRSASLIGRPRINNATSSAPASR